MPKECGKVPAHYCDSIHRGNLAEKKMANEREDFF